MSFRNSNQSNPAPKKLPKHLVSQAFAGNGLLENQRTSAPSASASQPMLDTAALARIGSFELLAQTVVDGVMSGKHRSSHKGGCCEFSEHRAYTQGDEVRLIDWRLFARRDRYYVKLYDDETNLHGWLVVDASGSMNFGQSTVSKFDYARSACACLGRLLLKQRDSIGLVMESAERKVHLPPRPQASHFQGICNALRIGVSDGNRPLAEVLTDLPKIVKRRGMVIVFSDCFGDVKRLANSLKQLRLRGHDVMVFQVLAPEEITFSFRKSAIFEDLESIAPRLRIHPGQVRKRYLERFQAFQKQLKEELVKTDCDLCTISTEDDLGDALTHFLSYRAAKRKMRSRGSA